MILSLISKELSNISLTVYDAYDIVNNLPDRNVLLNCIETDDLWAFRFHYEPVEYNDIIVGGGYDAINKNTGEHSVLSIPWDVIGVLDEGKAIDISIFTD